jgi:acetolactate synthase-1/2/3 large subunit
MRVSDYIAEKMYSVGVDSVFLVTGGGMMFLTDGIASNTNIQAIPCLHEQAAAYAAIAYAQYRNDYGLCMVTTGCGGTNAITGVLHAYQDHIPVVFIAGQCNRSETMSSAKSKVRQIGFQEADLIPIVQSITKYAVTVNDPNEIRHHLEKALFLSKSGSPGPVWLSIPLDVQEAIVDIELIRGFSPSEVNIKQDCTAEEIDYVVSALQSAERPIVVGGRGVKIAKADELFLAFCENHNFPYVNTIGSIDLSPITDRLHIGTLDVNGSRAANFAVQNADVVLIIGSRLAQWTTGYNYDLFARTAKSIIVVDIDEEEHKKDTVRIDKVINADAKKFFEQMPELHPSDANNWSNKCQEWKHKWSVFSPLSGDDSNGISRYDFMNVINENLTPNSVIITDAGSSFFVPIQAVRLTKATQRYLTCPAQGEMGYSLPASVGASVSDRKSDVICIVGDGSLQMNIQELQTLVTNNLRVKIFVWNNDGYASIRSQQASVFSGRFLGVDKKSGLGLPNLEKIAAAYGIEYHSADTLQELKSICKDISDNDAPIIVEVRIVCDEARLQAKPQHRLPDGRRVALPLEDMLPLLPREELYAEMIVEPIKWE